MSVRAYKITVPAELDDNPSFNLWHDEKLVAYLQSKTSFYGDLGEEGTGTTGLEVKEIKEIIEKAAELELDEETVKQLQKDIVGLDDNDYVNYTCF